MNQKYFTDDIPYSKDKLDEITQIFTDQNTPLDTKHQIKENYDNKNLVNSCDLTVTSNDQDNLSTLAEFMNGNGLCQFSCNTQIKPGWGEPLRTTLKVKAEHFGYGTTVEIPFLNIRQLQILINMLQSAEKKYIDKYNVDKAENNI